MSAGTSAAVPGNERRGQFHHAGQRGFAAIAAGTIFAAAAEE